MAIKDQAITICYKAWNTSTNSGQTGDAGNHTLKLIQDGTEGTPTNNPSEVDSTNLPGTYKLALTAGDMNYNSVVLDGKSSTANVVIIGPLNIITERGNINAGGNLPGATGGIFIAGTNAATTVTTSFTTTFTGNLTGNVGGNVTGSVGSISGVTFPTRFSSLAIDTNGYVTFNNTTIGSVTSVTNAVTVSLSETLNSPRALDSIADGSIQINDALWAAIGAGVGIKDASSGTSLVVSTPHTATVLRTYVITTTTAPTTVPDKIA